jgi:zinc transport system substrate-binding protein
MRFLVTLGVLAAFHVSSAAAEPHVVASFAPLQSIVASVMEGVGTPETIVKGGASPHSYALKPSDARLLERADLIFWVGPGYENFLVRPLQNLGGKARKTAWADLPGINLLAAREGGPWEGHSHAHGHAHAKGAVENDGHLFLDPRNAVILAEAAADALAQVDPANAARYRANALRVKTELAALDAELAAKLRPLAGRPFIVFHDALQYFEKRYGLTPAGSITVSPERKPGAQRLQRIRERVRRAQAICVFAEPQFEPSLVATIVEGTNARVASIDYVGVDIAPGPGAYAAILRKMAADLAGCLNAS